MNRKIIALIFGSLLLFSCLNDSTYYKNPYIPEYAFSYSIKTSLPEYGDLIHVANPVFIPYVGVKGIIVMKVNINDYRAFEASCPNQYPNECSRMTVKKGSITVVCPCDNLEYNLFTGLGQGEYAMKPYKLQVSGDIIRVYN